MKSHNHYADEVLDRASHLRKDNAWLDAQYHADHTMVIPVWRSRNLIENGPEPRGVMLQTAETRALIEMSTTNVLLGVRNDVAHFAIDISPLEAHEVNELRADGEFVDLRSVGAVLDRTEASILAYAKGIMHWHSRHMFCGVCGSPTESQEAGHLRKCLNRDCGAVHFPRTDPAVIMLVEDCRDPKRRRCLLARNSRFPSRMMSTLAGFVDPLESLEETVEREVFEECGIHVTDIEYQASQPWPFPSSIMLGFRARATSFDIVVDGIEIDEAYWFEAEQLQTFGEWGDGGDNFSLPRQDSIARYLVNDWMTEVLGA